MDRALEAGLRIPRDIAVVGSGNFHYSSRLRVPLSSIDQKAEEIGERTARMITGLLEKSPPHGPAPSCWSQRWSSAPPQN